MPFDPESRNISRPGGEQKPGAQPQSRVSKPLGRGLEDISHLFLSNGTDKIEREAGSDTASDRTPGWPARRPVISLRHGAVLTKDQVMSTLRDCPSVLAENLRAIDASVSCHPFGEIDLIVTNGTNELAIIDINLAYSDSLLLRGLSHVDWIVRNARGLQRIYRESAVDFARSPRLFLVAPQFSPAMTAAVRQVSVVDVRCFRCHSVDLGGGIGIFFEPMAAEDN